MKWCPENLILEHLLQIVILLLNTKFIPQKLEEFNLKKKNLYHILILIFCYQGSAVNSFTLNGTKFPLVYWKDASSNCYSSDAR